MSKFVLISGSPRSKGNTAFVLNEMANIIREMGDEVQIFSLVGKNINSCKACNACKSTGKCSIDDGMNEIAAVIKEAEGLVVGAPVYFGTARGDMMNFLQRLGMLNLANQRFLDGKVGGPVAVARRGGHTATIQEMLMFFFINGMVVPGAKYWNMGFGGGAGEVAQDEEGMENFRLFAAKLSQLAAKLKK
ncbi:MAG: flavodoxin family protein [Bacillota bacterium]|nr:flavodoxin family protein [Bacillota bacterium]